MLQKHVFVSVAIGLLLSAYASAENITVTDPNGGEEMVAGQPYKVLWTSSETIENVKIEYSSDDGDNWILIDSNTANTGSFDWTLPVITSDRCLVRISDVGGGDANDVSNSVFMIYKCILLFDLNGDCIINFKDISLVAGDWLNDCGNPYYFECTGNHPPQITSTPVTMVTQNVLYSYDVEAEDPDLWDLISEFSLAVYPTGMTIDANNGLIQWTPTPAEVGDHNVTVVAADTMDANDVQSFVITVEQYNQIGSNRINHSGYMQFYTDYLYPPAGKVITDWRYTTHGTSNGGSDNGTYIDTGNNRLVIKTKTGGYENCWQDGWGVWHCDQYPGFFDATYYIYEGDYSP